MQTLKEEIFCYQEIINYDTAISIDQEACSDSLEPWKHGDRLRSLESVVINHFVSMHHVLLSLIRY